MSKKNSLEQKKARRELKALRNKAQQDVLEQEVQELKVLFLELNKKKIKKGDKRALEENESLKHRVLTQIQNRIGLRGKDEFLQDVVDGKFVVADLG